MHTDSLPRITTHVGNALLSACAVNSRRVGGSRNAHRPEAGGEESRPYGAERRGRRAWQQRKGLRAGRRVGTQGLYPIALRGRPRPGSVLLRLALLPPVMLDTDGAPRGGATPMTTPRPRSRQPKQLNAGIFQAEISSFALRLAAERKAAKTTIRTYTEAVRWFAAACLLGHASRASWEQVSSQDIQRWMAWLLARYSTAYASNQYRALQQFFKWLAAEDGLPDPMAGLQPPHVPDRLVPVFTPEELARLEHACAGRSFTQRRDTAIIAVSSPRPASGYPSWPACGAARSTCGSGRSRSAARAARTGSSRSATRPPGAWIGTSAPAPGTGRPGGRSYGSAPATGSRWAPPASTR